MAMQTQPSRISEPFAGSGSKNAIPATNATPSASQAASWASGFPPECSQPISAGGCPVPRDDMNGVLNQLSQDYSFRQDGGVWEWSALADYDVGRVVRGSDGLLYRSKAQSGASLSAGAQNPTTDSGVYWSALPLDNADVVHKSGIETITGKKTFTSSVTVYNASPQLTLIDKDATLTNLDGYSTTYVRSYCGSEADENESNRIGLGTNQHGNSYIYQTLFKRSSNASAKEANITFLARYADSSDYAHFFMPDGDSIDWIYLGSANNRWKTVYGVNSFNSSSDLRLKEDVSPVSDAVLDVWEYIDWKTFKRKEAVQREGVDKARCHSGLVAQEVQAAFEAAGLDACAYGFFCHDKWTAQEEVKDKDGHVVQHAREAGDVYSLRYEEALCIEAAYQRRRADRAEARIAALEERLAAIEAKLNS